MQEQKLVAINKSLQIEIQERKASEERVKELNRQLLENIARLESANKDLDRFAFMASHDLQEPLRKIRIFSDLLYVKYKTLLDEEGKLNITRIQNAAERMQALIKDILTFSKISVEKGMFEKTNLNNVVDDVLTELDATVQEKHAKVQVDMLPTLQVNPGLIRPLFYNLISNALKYSKKNEPPVVSIRSEMPSNGLDPAKQVEHKYCRIYIQDNGIGFDQKYSEEIFGMFKRLHLSTEYEGTGIGLALCKKIVEEHNGFISAKSKVNEGSTFIISLPVKQAVEAAVAEDQQ